MTDNYNGNIIKFNASWDFITYKHFANDQFTFLKIIENKLFITGYNGFYQLDANLNLIKIYNSTAANYRSLYFNKINGYFYLCSLNQYSISVLDIDLNFKKTINMQSTGPITTIAGSNQNLYVGTYTGNVIVLENELIIKTFTRVCEKLISSITIDAFGFMYISCSQEIRVYDINGKFLSSFVLTQNLFQTGIDSSGRLIVFNSYTNTSTGSKIDIFY